MPPNGTRRPRFWNWSAIAWAFLIVWAWSCLNCLVCASLNVSASAANTWTCGPPCSPGKTALSIFLAMRRVGGQKHRPARAVETLVRGGHDHVGNADRRRHHARRHQPADVGNIRQEVGTDLIRNLAELPPIRHPGIGRVPGDQQLRFGFERLGADPVVVEPFVFIHGIVHRLEPLSRAVDG